ncbi:hypothetical protein BCR33DRAFT_863848 [Rhizoclosmatium globosum]|uniref:Uncharacterized protein n=1 Tax=Rhizoclosmatium globosum TaxID=329046 RepID=A0A1Y2A0S8_9FUNG|nr:hypothetical protein BCR33DRAFT_863848 [Rhizoclosmatium globosum]|eukprot:ORY16048.1 hypothetical protein BCR33DRAFT_863848 [Rhizoclosmatium globosum]
MADETQQENNAPPVVSLYTNVINMIVGDFKGQQTAPVTRTISSNTLDEFKSMLWIQVHPLIVREIIVQQSGGYEFGPKNNDQLTVEDMGNFVLVQKCGRTAMKLSEVTAEYIQKHRNKTITIYVQKYSNNLSRKDQFSGPAGAEKLLLKPQNTNRGVPQQILSSKRLNDFAWGLWANSILAGPAHSKEQRMTLAPPNSLISHFRSVDNSAEAQQRVLIQCNRVAIERNSAHLVTLQELLETAKVTKRHAEETLENAKIQIVRLEEAINVSNGIVPVLEGFASAVNPTPTAESLQFQAQVENRDDDDHTI